MYVNEVNLTLMRQSQEISFILVFPGFQTKTEISPSSILQRILCNKINENNTKKTETNKLPQKCNWLWWFLDKHVTQHKSSKWSYGVLNLSKLCLKLVNLGVNLLADCPDCKKLTYIKTFKLYLLSSNYNWLSVLQSIICIL